jgi:hypothetical protein
MAAKGKLNPFQIEDDEKWEGDFYDEEMDEYDDMSTREARGLLGSAGHPASAASRATTGLPGERRTTAAKLPSKRSSSCQMGRILTMLGVTAIIVWIVLSSSSNNTTPPGPTESKEQLPAVTNLNKQEEGNGKVPVAERASPVFVRSPPASAPPTTTGPTTGGAVIPPTIDSDEEPDENIVTSLHDDFVPSERVPADAAVVNDDDWDDSLPGGKPLRPYDPTPKPLYFVVLGERHSGVEYILQTLEHCYGDIHRYGNGYHRDAPWFQTYDNEDVPFRMDAHMHYRLVLILATRNVYDWVQDMYNHPLYLGDISSSAPTLKDFVQSEWSYPALADNSTNGFCQFNFLSGQITPCLEFQDAYRFPTTVPVYELNATSRLPYKNILQLRSAKIQYWMETLKMTWMMEPIILHMDENGETAWTNEFANQLLNRTAGQDLCFPPSTNPTTATVAPSYNPESYADASSAKFMDWMNDNVDWAMERKIGYIPREGRERRHASW